MKLGAAVTCALQVEQFSGTVLVQKCYDECLQLLLLVAQKNVYVYI